MDDSLRSILNHWDVETRIEPAGMSRVVDARAALEAIPAPEYLRGEAVLSLADERAPWNAGTWRIAADGGCVQVTRTDREAGVEMDIQALTQAYWGTPSLEDLRRWDRLEVRDEAQFGFLNAVLPPHRAWLNDDF
jgi:predicted acetyltransferase